MAPLTKQNSVGTFPLTVRNFERAQFTTDGSSAYDQPGKGVSMREIARRREQIKEAREQIGV